MLLSVIIASYNSRATIGRCLDALGPQMTPDVEVLVADSSTDGTAELLRERYPWVRLLWSEERLFPGGARNRAIEASSGDILAFIDADCIAAPDWIERAIEAQKRWGPVVGGSVDNANPAEAGGWLYYFCEFAPWMPGRPMGRVSECPTCCLTVQRAVLEQTGCFRASGYSSDSAFHWRLRRAGMQPWFDPELRVSHINPSRFQGVLRKMRMHGEHFASARCEEGQLGRAAALCLWIGSPLLPPLLLWRRTRQIWQTGWYRAEFLRTVPGLTMALVAWSYGEWRGYGRWVRSGVVRQ